MKRTLAGKPDRVSSRRSSRLLLVMLLLGATAISGDDYLWDTRFAPDGGLVEGGSVKSLLHDRNGLVYAIGSFSAIGGVKSRQIAVWDGEQWLPIGNGLRGRQIFGADLDSQDNLLVAGDLTIANTGVETSVAIWDGQNWSPFGTGRQRQVLAMDIDGADHVWIGGGGISSAGSYGFGLLEGDGTQWVKRGPLRYVTQITADHQGNVYASGEIPGSILHYGVWNGSEWSPLTLPDGLSNARLEAAANGDLYAIGGHAIYVRTDSLWAMMGPPDSRLLTSFDIVASGDVFRSHKPVDSSAPLFAERWDGIEWQPLGGQFKKTAGTAHLIGISSDPEGRLFANGVFDEAGDRGSQNMVSWEDDDWARFLPAGLGPDGVVNTVYSHGDGRIFLSGGFRILGDVYAPRNAVWDGSQWVALDPESPLWFREYATDSKGQVFAIAGSGLFKWTGQHWAHIAVTKGFGYPDGTSTATTLAIDNNDKIYIGGFFDEVEGVQAKRIAVWNGVQWQSLGEGIGGSPNKDHVWSILVAPDGDVFVGGLFSTAGDIEAMNIARWDGSSWSALGSGLRGHDPRVRALEWLESSLYAGGVFQHPSGSAIRNIARWDGQIWQALEQGVNAGVSALQAHGSHLYVGGNFEWATNIRANNIARWDGSQWSALGSGANGPVQDITVGADSSLYLAGGFTVIDGVPSNHFARAEISEISPDPEDPGEADISVYPNPATTQIHVLFSLAETSSTTISIFDALGRRVSVFPQGELQGGHSHRFDVDVSNLSSGSYFVNVVAGGSTITATFVVVRTMF